MIVHEWGEVPYDEAMAQMRKVHRQAVEDGKNHLIFCSHPELFTVGADDKGKWDVPTVRSDRGGAITCHSPGQLVTYFCFQAAQPARFYRNVCEAYRLFFKSTLPAVVYKRKQPGFYIENRKIASLGFRYANGVSLHGVSLNVDVDLTLHNRVNPCGLEGIHATSLVAEGVTLSMANVKSTLQTQISEVFGDPIQA